MIDLWLPMPPSHNACYRNVPGVGRVATAELRSFLRQMDDWAMEHIRLVHALRRAVEPPAILHVESYLIFPRKKLWTKEGKPKIMDTSNRLKALHDALAEILLIDDSSFWSCAAEKIEDDASGPERALTRLFIKQPQKLSELLPQILPRKPKGEPHH